MMYWKIHNPPWSVPDGPFPVMKCNLTAEIYAPLRSSFFKR